MSGYVRLMRDIWSDPDWLALRSTTKLVYLQLISQPDISRVGVLPQVPGRWASMHPDLAKADILAALAELTEGRFIIVDDETEEVWIRTYIVHDELYKIPNGIRSLHVAASEVISPMLRDLIAEQVKPLITKPKSEAPEETSDNPSVNPSENPSDEGSAIPLSLVPSPSTLNPEPSSPEPSDHARYMTQDSRAVVVAEIVPEDDFAHFWSTYPRKTQKSTAAKRWANMKRADRLAALDALPAHVEHWQRERTEPKFIPHAATWLNQRRWEDQLPEPQAQTLGLSKAAQTIQEMMKDAILRESQDRRVPRRAIHRME
jgi:hypothetical protein